MHSTQYWTNIPLKTRKDQEIITDQIETNETYRLNAMWYPGLDAEIEKEYL